MNDASRPPVPSRELLVEGRPIRVFDGLLPNVADYVQGLSRAAFTRWSWRSTSGSPRTWPRASASRS